MLQLIALEVTSGNWIFQATVLALQLPAIASASSSTSSTYQWAWLWVKMPALRPPRAQAIRARVAAESPTLECLTTPSPSPSTE